MQNKIKMHERHKLKWNRK